MKFNEETINKIDKVLTDKKCLKPVHGSMIGIGVHLEDSKVYKCSDIICDVEELKRTIEELQMLKESIEEVTGLVL